MKYLKIRRFGAAAIASFLASCAFVAQLNAEELHIEAQKVSSDERKGITTAEGSVHMVKEKDVLNADKVNIYMDKNRKPLKFEAIGKVDFILFTEDGRELRGKSNTLIYLIQENEYQLIGNAQVQEIGKPNFLKGERIILNNENGYANVESDKSAPVRVIIDLNDMQDEKNKDAKK